MDAHRQLHLPAALERAALWLRATQEWLGEPADVSIRRFLFDTVVHDPALLRAVIETVGADRVLLGSDYPFDMADPRPVETVRAARLSEEDEAAVLSGNAERLLALGVR